MKLLLVNTAFDVAEYGLYIDGVVKVLTDAVLVKHSETALYDIDKLLSENHLDINDIDVFAVNIGPGSFTGIRIGLSLVKGLMAGIDDKKLVTFNSLEAVAKCGDGEGLILLKASKDDYYGCDYDGKTVSNLRVVSEEERGNAIVRDNSVDVDRLVLLAAAKAMKGEFSDVDQVSPLYLKLSQAERQLEAKNVR